MNPVRIGIPYINTGFWLKIMLEIQILIHEINDFNVIDVIHNIPPQVIYYLIKRNNNPDITHPYLSSHETGKLKSDGLKLESDTTVLRLDVLLACDD
jgi:hypothetical protein|nr:MAG TPA: hypothetical protein [Caudoviricetes sp.]